MTTNDLLKVWFNWVRRKVPATPRKLFVSNAFWNDEAASANRRDIERMFSCIERGDCLDGFLSKRANQALPLRDKRNNRVELDLLLNDWAVHHLHPNRNDVLVFMFFTTDEAFALIAGKHRDMTSRRMVEAAVETWPEREIFLEMKGTIGLSRDLDEKQAGRLRHAFVNSPIPINNRFYVGRGFLSSAGTSIYAVRQAHHLRSCLSNFVDKIRDNPWYYHKLAMRYGSTLPLFPNYAVEFRARELGVRELVSGTYFRLA